MLRQFFIAATVLVIVPGCSSTKTSSTSNSIRKPQNQLQPITAVADGNSREWADSFVRFDNSLRCFYAFGTDGNHLFVMLKTSDKQQQLKIIQGGLALWLDESSKKKETTGIKYPIGGKTLQPPNRTGSSQPDLKQIKQEARLQLIYMELSGFKDGFNGKQSANSQQPIRAAIDWDEKDNIVYEASIPIAALPYGTTANTVSIGIVIKGLKMPERMGGGMGGMQPPAGMMPPGGGQMPNMRDIEELTKDNKARFTYTFK